MCTAAFGLAVVPEVCSANSMCSASSRSGSQVSGWLSTSSCHQRSRPSAIATSAPVRLSTTIPVTEGASFTAASAISFSGTRPPLRQASSWVITTLAPVPSRRSPSDSAENPPKTTTCGAPRRAQASIATGSSGTMPM